MIPYNDKDFMDIFQSALYAPDPAAYILEVQQVAEKIGIGKSGFVVGLQKPFKTLSLKYQQSVEEVAKRNQLNRDTGIDEFHYSLGDGKGLSFEEFQAHEDTARQKDLDDAVEGMEAFNVLAGIIFDALEQTENADKTNICKAEITPDYSKLGEYFKPVFKGWGNGKNLFSSFIEELENLKGATASAKEFAQVALMCYEGDKMNGRKPQTFKQWYRIFCDLIGCEHKSYDPNKLRDIPENLRNVFAYLG